MHHHTHRVPRLGTVAAVALHLLALALGPAAVTVADDKLDELAPTLILPFYEIDRGNPQGQTTLYAVRNPWLFPIQVEVTYRNVFHEVQFATAYDLAPLATVTVNLRDVPDLGEDPDGFARGYAMILSPEPVAGDFFQVDVDGAFASGERLPSLGDLCSTQEVRFLDFGSGTDLQVWVGFPRGLDDGVNPPSFAVAILGEDGTPEPGIPVFTDQRVVSLSSLDLTETQHGTFFFDFLGSTGWVYAESAADGLFSVGLNPTCW